MASEEALKVKVAQLYMCQAPIGFIFAIMLDGSNTAYPYRSVALLQFMMEANAVHVFSFSALAGLQFISRQRVAVSGCVIRGSSLCVRGELHVLIGFMLKGAPQQAECARAVIRRSAALPGPTCPFG